MANLASIPKTTFNRRLDGTDPWTTKELAAVAKVLDCDPAEFIPPASVRQAQAS